MFNGMSDLMGAIPKLLEMQPLAEQFITQWLAFMNDLGEKLTKIDERTERTDNKVSLIISMLNENKITAALHDEVITNAALDPRNISNPYPHVLTGKEIEYGDRPG